MEAARCSRPSSRKFSMPNYGERIVEHPLALLNRSGQGSFSKPLLYEKELPPTPLFASDDTAHDSSLSSIREQLRSSSMYSRPTGWEAPSWWHSTDDSASENFEGDIDYCLMRPIAAHTDARQKLEGSMLEFAIEGPRAYSPLLPEPSPSPPPLKKRSSSILTASNTSPKDSGHSTPEDNDGMTPLPPTPPTPTHPSLHSQFPPDEQLKSRSTSPRLLPNLIRRSSTVSCTTSESPPNTSDSHPFTFKADRDSFYLKSAKSSPGLGTYEESFMSYDDVSMTNASKNNFDQVLRESRGRSLQRRPPPHNRDRNYPRPLDKQPERSGSEHGSIGGSSVYSTDSKGTDPTSSICDSLQVRQARTLSEAYYNLLIEEYQGLAAEGRAWEGLQEHIATASEDGREIKLVPAALHVKKQDTESKQQPQESDGKRSSGDKNETRTSMSKKRGRFRRFKKHDSSTSGEIPISPPFDEVRGTPGPQRKVSLKGPVSVLWSQVTSYYLASI